MTLFFFQLFITITTNGDDIFGTDVTGGSNGISGVAASVDPLSFFGWELPQLTEGGVFNIAYIYVALVAFVIVFVALRFLNDSRTGRAWRSLREDPLAAEMMGMPVNWLKLMAFSFGAAVAALTGTIFASLNAGVFPNTFQFPLLITVYAMVILGGAGSMSGVVVGAIVVNVLLEVLREPGDARVRLLRRGARGSLRDPAALGPPRDRARWHGRARVRRPCDRGGDLGSSGRGVERGRRLDDRRGRALGRVAREPRILGADLVRRPRRRRADPDDAQGLDAHRAHSSRRSTSPRSSGRT